MSASPIPDIDRLSMEQRIRRLEAGGGSGGGGAGVGMPDFDQYPDNAFSESPYGIICKISIDDFANQNVPELSGLGLKACVLMSYVISWGLVQPKVLARAHLKKQYGRVITTTRHNIQSNITLANQNIVADLQTHNHPAGYNPSSPSFQVSVYAFRQQNGGGEASGSVGLCSVRIDAMAKGKVVLGVISSTFKPEQTTSYPCYMFGCGFATPSQSYSQYVNVTAGSSLGKIQNNSWISTAQLSDLPVSALNLYPKSWCV